MIKRTGNTRLDSLLGLKDQCGQSIASVHYRLALEEKVLQCLDLANQNQQLQEQLSLVSQTSRQQQQLLDRLGLQCQELQSELLECRRGTPL